MLPPVGAAYISANLKKNGFPVTVFNACFVSQKDIAATLSRIISQNDIQIIGCGGLVTDYPQIKETIDAARTVRPDIVTFIGGALVTYSPVDAMRLIPNADIGVIGEGEITVCELAGALENGQDLSSVKGLIIRDKNDSDRFTFTDNRVPPNVDTLPWPDYEGFGIYDLYKDSLYGAVTTSRGCPYSCTFCVPSGSGRYRQRCLDDIFSEIDFLIDRYNIRNLYLSDELFAADSDRIFAFCTRAESYGIKWRVFMRASGAYTPGLFETMKNSGCESVYFGLESADDRILESMNKGFKRSDIEHTLKLVKNADLHTTGAFIFGDPAETLDTMQTTIDWVFENRDLLDRVSLEPITLYPGSTLYQNAVKSGIISNTADFIQNGCPLINVSRLTNDQYHRMVHEILPAANKKLMDEALAYHAKTGIKNWMP